MIDRQKIIKGLEICVDRVPGTYRCNECPYEVDGNDCEINLTKDALTLLKEQEAVEPKSKPSGGWLKTKELWFCGACGARISRRRTKYCQECGKAVKW